MARLGPRIGCSALTLPAPPVRLADTPSAAASRRRRCAAAPPRCGRPASRCPKSWCRSAIGCFPPIDVPLTAPRRASVPGRRGRHRRRLGRSDTAGLCAAGPCRATRASASGRRSRWTLSPHTRPWRSPRGGAELPAATSGRRRARSRSRRPARRAPLARSERRAGTPPASNSPPPTSISSSGRIIGSGFGRCP